MNAKEQDYIRTRVPHLAPHINGAVHAPIPHESAMGHVSGEAVYTDDIPELQGTVHAALGLSTHAHAKIVSMDLSAVRSVEGVMAVLTAKDIPGDNQCGPIIHDEPVFPIDTVTYLGQPIFAVVAQTRAQARSAAKLAHIEYQPLEAVLSPRQGHERKSYVVPPVIRTRGQPTEAINRAKNKLAGSFSVGGQEQFYLEGQIAYAVPKEEGAMLVYASTQHPTEMQHTVAHFLGVPINKVVVDMRRMGGGFGGKESQSAIFCAVASLAASVLKKPVKLRPDRDDDFMITGKRHDFDYDFEVGFNDEGLIEGVRVAMFARAGHTADLSGPVIARAVTHFDNAYYLENVEVAAYAVRTHTQSNTAFRGFGGPQGAFAIEYILDGIAHYLGQEPLAIRRINFYGKEERNITHYDALVEDNIIEELVDDLEKTAHYHARKKAVREFNRGSPIIKKGIALTPLKFGISFNLSHLNQAGALVHVYTDGSVMVSHGGTEMGQGLNTKVAQVVAQVLGISVDRVKTTSADTSKVPNTSATAASTGADINGKAAEDAALNIRTRLAQFLAKKWGAKSDDIVFQDGGARWQDQSINFPELCQNAYMARVQLWSDGFYATPKIHWHAAKVSGKPFYYYAYGASISEVVLDSLTGEWRVLRVDILHDAGRSLNPAIDIGQIEGAFIQGMGWLTTEELWWNGSGKLMTHAPSTYKIPAVHDAPPIFNTRLYPSDNVEDTIFRSKAVGEPPLLHGFSVFFALRDALSCVHGEEPLIGMAPPLQAPATPEAILKASAAVCAQRLKKQNH